MKFRTFMTIVTLSLTLAACGGGAASSPADTPSDIPDTSAVVVQDAPTEAPTLTQSEEPAEVIVPTPTAIPGVTADGALSRWGDQIRLYLMLNYTTGSTLDSSHVYVMVNGEDAVNATCNYEGLVFVVDCYVPQHYTSLQVKVTSGIVEGDSCTIDVPTYTQADRQDLALSCFYVKLK